MALRKRRSRLVATLPLLSLSFGLVACPLKSFEVEDPPAAGGVGGGAGVPSGGEGPSPGGLGGTSEGAGVSAPSLTNDRYIVRQGGELEVSAPEGLLSNDAPVALRVVDYSAAPPSRPVEFNPELDIHEDGGFSFKPVARFFGVYRVSYTAENRAKLRRNAELSIHVVPTEIELDAVAAGVGGFVLDGARADALGTALARAGDVNADGRSDMVIGAPGSGGGHGAAYLLFGDERALPLTLTPALAQEQDARFAVFVGGPGEALGASVAAPGDFDSDGRADLALGASGGNGRVYVVSGASPGTTQELPSDDGFTYEGDASNLGVGELVGGAGDVNRDGAPDLLISSRRLGYGWINVLFGPGTTPGAIVPVVSAAGSRIRGSEPSDGFPLSAASMGDLDGDGSSEVFAASFRSFVLLKSGTSYPAATGDLSGGSEATRGWFLARRLPSGGAAVSSAGDLDGDELSDVAYCDGVAYCRVVFSPPATLASGWTFSGFSETATRALVSGAGDVDGDALDDLLIAEDSHAYVVHGRRAGHRDLNLSELGAAGFSLALPSGGTISSAAIVGDLNQDGLDDLAIGDASAESGAGRVYVVFGVASD